MSKFPITNDVRSELTQAIDSTQTTMRVAKSISPFRQIPALGAGETLHLTIVDNLADVAKIEIVNVTAISDQTSYWQLTIERGAEGTSPYAFDAGAPVFLAITQEAYHEKVDLDELLAGSWTWSGDQTIRNTSPFLRLRDQDGAVVAGDVIGRLEFYTEDSTATAGVSAKIDALAVGSFGGTAQYTALRFFTTETAADLPGVERMRVDYNGNVGIGETTPLASLHVNGQTWSYYFRAIGNLAPTGSRLSFGWFNDNNYGWIQTFGGGALAINPLGNNVGIGTEDPSEMLDVDGNTRINGVLKFAAGAQQVQNVGDNTGSRVLDFDFSALSTNDGAVRVFRNTNTTGLKRFLIYRGDGTATVDHDFRGGATVSGVCLQAGSTFGVGGYSGGAKMEVSGDVGADQYHQNAIHAHGNTSGAKTIALADGNYQTMTLTGNSTFSFTAPPGPCSCNILITNSGAGNTITLPGSVVFETGAQSEADGAKYVLTIIYDGTDYWVSWAT